MIDELDLVTGLRPEVQPPTSEARRAARAALQHTIANDRHADADADRRVTGVRPSRRLRRDACWLTLLVTARAGGRVSAGSRQRR